MLCLFLAYRCRSKRWGTVPVQPWKLSGRLQGHTLHRVQRQRRYLPLLCQQVQLLADYHWSEPEPVCNSGSRNTEGWQPEDESVQMPGLHEDHKTLILNTNSLINKNKTLYFINFFFSWWHFMSSFVVISFFDLIFKGHVKCAMKKVML